MAKYEKVGEFSGKVYRKKKDNNVWGWIITIIIILALIGNCSGN